MRVLALAISLLASCASNASSRSPTPPAAETGPLARVAFIAGSWRGQTAEGVVEELWSAPSGGVMLGVGRIVQGEKLVLFEFLRIESRADGVVYIAQPRGGPATEFRLTNASEGSVTFDNPEHDFPRRIAYRRAGDGSLEVHVEGVESGKPLSENVTLHRVQ